MKKYFLDTSFLIDLMNEEPEAVEMHDEIRGREVTGTPCIYELSKFAQFDVAESFAGKEVLQFSTGDAEVSGSVYRELREEGEVIGETDLLIAGMSVNRGAVLVTRDRDFDKVEGLQTVFY